MDVGLHKRCRVIAPTYPGFGASQSNNGRTFLSFGEDVKELIDALQVNHASSPFTTLAASPCTTLAGGSDNSSS